VILFKYGVTIIFAYKRQIKYAKRNYKIYFKTVIKALLSCPDNYNHQIQWDKFLMHSMKLV